ncbi:hypothetical protein CPC08DRAFT_792461 [Agrocybe pediades]|nr:hypothetical protein CPC08DRAFT_792461 [Agrocybe pediades]
MSTPCTPTLFKKRKTGEHQDAVPTGTDVAPTNSSDFWWPDGTLVLEVERTRYRVHRTLLAYHSEFFRDLLCVQRPADPNGTMDGGTPTVILQDRKEDWDSPLHPRLGQKYLFTRFEETSRKKVLVILPTTPLEWTRFSYFGDPNTPPAKFVAGHEYELLKVTRKVGMAEVLPAAYLLCVWNCKDMSTLFMNVNNGQSRGASLADSEALILGRQRLFHASATRWNEHIIHRIASGEEYRRP